MPIRIDQETTLTGKLRVRKQSLTGKLILQVQVNLDTVIGLTREHNTGTKWRDATSEDVGLDFAALTVKHTLPEPAQAPPKRRTSHTQPPRPVRSS